MPRTRSQITELVVPTSRKRLASESDSAPPKKRTKTAGAASTCATKQPEAKSCLEFLQSDVDALPLTSDLDSARAFKKQPKRADASCSAFAKKGEKPEAGSDEIAPCSPVIPELPKEALVETTKRLPKRSSSKEAPVETTKRLSKRSSSKESTANERQEDEKKSTVSSGSLGCSNVQSSIPGMSIAEIRAVLGEQRKLFQDNGYVSLIDTVCPNMTRMEFDFRYVYGIAVKRHAKHKRASACNKDGDDDEGDDIDNGDV